MAKLDRFERFTLIAMGKRNPSEKEKEQMAKYRMAFSLSCQGFTVMEAAKEIEAQFNLSQSQAAKIVADAKVIYGDGYKMNKAAEQNAWYNFLQATARKAQSNGDLNAAIAAAREAIKLKGLNEINTDALDDPADYMKPEVFLISSDPVLLKAAKKVITLEIEAEEAQIVDEDGEGEDGGSDLSE